MSNKLNELRDALDATYPIPDSPHESVKQRARENRTAFIQGWQQKQAATEAAKATGTAGEIDADAEMAKVKRDVELMGVGFLVDGKRCSLDRITWFNRPGDTWLPPPPGYPTEAARQPAPALSDEEILMMASQHGVESREFSDECVISLVRAAISAATNRSQPEKQRAAHCPNCGAHGEHLCPAGSQP